MLHQPSEGIPNMTRSSLRLASTIGLLAAVSMLAAWRFPASAQDAKTPGKTPDYEAIVAAPDRNDADRQTDQRRQPSKMLASAGARPGMRVLDMEASGGYSTE